MRYFLYISFYLLISPCKGQSIQQIHTSSPQDFAARIKDVDKAQIVDVRTPEEFQSEHLENAINIDWLNENFVKNIEKLDKTQPVFIYCKSGSRGTNASKKLAALDFKKIYQLDGGLLNWNTLGLVQETNKNSGMTTEDYLGLLGKNKTVLINFYSKWCASCKEMKPYIDQIQKELTNQFVLIRIDADEHKTLVKKMNIVELPALLLYQDELLKWKNVGYISEKDLRKKLQ
jgi:rhodanese-related sulfurtransferase